MINNNIESLLNKKGCLSSLNSSSDFNFFENADKLKAQFIYDMIKERESISQKIINKIDDNIIYACNRIHQIEGNFSEKNELSTWQKQIMDLELKKETESLSLFKDTSVMKMELMKECINYFEIVRL